MIKTHKCVYCQSGTMTSSPDKIAPEFLLQWACDICKGSVITQAHTVPQPIYTTNK